jgi:hypothetical protein
LALYNKELLEKRLVLSRGLGLKDVERRESKKNKKNGTSKGIV